MLIYKIIGGGSIVVSALIFYFESQAYNKKALAQLDAYINLIEYIKNQVCCFLTPIDIILNNCDVEILKNCVMGEVSEPKILKTVGDIIDASYFYIEQDALAVIKRFGSDFGTIYRDEQLISCDLYIDELKSIKSKKKENFEKEKKVRLALCVCLSVSMILLLI